MEGSGAGWISRCQAPNFSCDSEDSVNSNRDSERVFTLKACTKPKWHSLLALSSDEIYAVPREKRRENPEIGQLTRNGGHSQRFASSPSETRTCNKPVNSRAVVQTRRSYRRRRSESSKPTG